MRHRIRQRKLNRTSAHRKALHRNLAQSLIEHGQVTTTGPKARDIRPYFERLISLAVKVRQRRSDNDHAGALRARRSIYRMLGDRSLIPADHKESYDGMSDTARTKSVRMASGRRHRTGDPSGRLAFTGETVIHRLIENVAPRFENRPGGYTRLVRLPKRRLGDNSELALLQLVGNEQAPSSLTKPRKTRRNRQADARYAMAVKLARRWSQKTQSHAGGRPEVSDGEAEAPTESEAAGNANTTDAEGNPVEPND